MVAGHRWERRWLDTKAVPLMWQQNGTIMRGKVRLELQYSHIT